MRRDGGRDGGRERRRRGPEGGKGCRVTVSGLDKEAVKDPTACCPRWTYGTGAGNRARRNEKGATSRQARKSTRSRRAELCLQKNIISQETQVAWGHSGRPCRGCVCVCVTRTPGGENHEVPRTLGNTCPCHLTEDHGV